MRVAMLSGGKESFYAALKAWPIDLGLLLIYDLPRPSPHLINLGKSTETLTKAGIPVLVFRVRKGREKEETAELLSRLGAKEVVAGDVSIEEHVKYMESVVSEAGAKLLEPLWGRNPEELLWEEFEEGLKSLVIGVYPALREWLGREILLSNLQEFLNRLKVLGADPLGEFGEYHTLVVESPLHKSRLDYEVIRVEERGDYLLARVI